MALMDKWHLGRAGQRSGPFSWAQIEEMGRAGQLFASDIIWQEGSPAWISLATLADKLKLSAPPMPATPVAATVAAPVAPPVVAAPVVAAPAPAPVATPAAATLAGQSPAPPTGAPGAPAPVVPASFIPAPLAPVRLAPAGPDFNALKQRFMFHFHRAVEWNLRTVAVSDDETKELLALGVDDEDARRYHAWRHSVLWAIVVAGTLAAVLGLIDSATADDHGMVRNALGKFLEFVRVCSTFVMPIAVYLAAKVWSRHARSRRLLFIGWATAFLAPLVFSLFPITWCYVIQQGEQAEVGARLLGAISCYVILMPTVLALIPGVMRACLRIKVLLPQSILPGWFLIGVSPFWMFLFMAIFATINQVAGDALLMIGVVAVAGAPALYLRRVQLFTRPILSDDDQRQVLQVQRYVRFILAAGVGFLILWLFSATVLGKSIIGTNADTSLVRPWSLSLFEFPIEFASHSLCTMALAADVFMAMNLSVWKHGREFVASPAARDYDRRMGEIEEGGNKE